MINWQDKSMIF